ncbi:hypothetical protein PCANC_28374 [Puccinia coronata f. sp. avenae]|uniref:Uncharacterized protein n=1 Tax=Puccinia coronata f. sp. avenae TaxID=200324 RepID=A0A2N5RYC0_9BASI|nr:hypothetical protein PCANC_28374 [Puccinia coronata f. sp. avenae]
MQRLHAVFLGVRIGVRMPKWRAAIKPLYKGAGQETTYASKQHQQQLSQSLLVVALGSVHLFPHQAADFNPSFCLPNSTIRTSTPDPTCSSPAHRSPSPALNGELPHLWSDKCPDLTSLLCSPSLACSPSSSGSTGASPPPRSDYLLALSPVNVSDAIHTTSASNSFLFLPSRLLSSMSLAPFTPGALSKVPPLSPLPANIEILTPDSRLPGCSDELASNLPACCVPGPALLTTSNRLPSCSSSLAAAATSSSLSSATTTAFLVVAAPAPSLVAAADTLSLATTSAVSDSSANKTESSEVINTPLSTLPLN